MEQETIAWGRPGTLAEAYLQRDSAVADRFDYLPWEPGSWRERAVRLEEQEGLRADRGAVASVLAAYNRRAGAGEAVMARIAQLAAPGTLAVVGGQQAGLFTGPLLCIHKAWTIIQCARSAERELGRPVVPVFWIAGEDHDFEEINHTHYLTEDLRIGRIKVGHPGGGRVSASRLPIPGEAWEKALSELDGLLPDTDRKPELLRRLAGILRDSATLTDQFARIMAWLFGRHGLILLDSDDPEWRMLQGPLFERLIRRSGELSEAYVQAAADVKRLGFEPQAEVHPDSLNLFYYAAGERELLYRKEAGAGDRGGRFRISEEELLRQAGRSPERFSNNVLTRPIMQDYMLPVLATVLGRGEIAYWAQLKQAFHLLGRRIPLIVPRAEATLIEASVRKRMDQFGLGFLDAAERYAAWREEWLVRQDDCGIRPAFGQAAEQARALYEPLLALAVQVNPGLRKLAERNREQVLDQIRYLERRTLDAFEQRHETALRQLERIRLTILPLEQPQDRVYNVFAVLNRHGIEWLDQLVSQPLPPDGRHAVMYL